MDRSGVSTGDKNGPECLFISFLYYGSSQKTFYENMNFFHSTGESTHLFPVAFNEATSNVNVLLLKKFKV